MIAPGPFKVPIMGNLFSFKGDIPNKLLHDRSRFGDIIYYRIFGEEYYLVSHPDYIRTIFTSRRDNYNKQTRSTKNLRLVTGDSLLTHDGDLWVKQRRLMQPLFKQSQVDRYDRLMIQAVEDIFPYWDQYASTAKPVDLANEMMKITFAMIGKVLLSHDLTRSADIIDQSMTIALKYIYQRLEAILPLSMKIPTLKRNRFKRAMSELNRVVTDIVKNRRLNSRDYSDLLSVLIDASDDNANSMSVGNINNELITMLLAGHETTANALTWTWYLLDKNNACFKQLQQEVDDCFRNSQSFSTEMTNLSYAKMIFQEVLRLYPPIWAIERNVVEDDTLGHYRVAKNATVIVSPYVVHRHPDYWQNPEAFRPYRFSKTSSAERADYIYLPFAKGPRTCIGLSFAFNEALIILSMLIQRYTITLVDDKEVKPIHGITLRPKQEIKVLIKRR